MVAKSSLSSVSYFYRTYITPRILFIGKCNDYFYITMQFQLSIHDDATSPEGSMTVFPGAKARYTESLSFLTPSSNTEGIPVYRVMDKKGDIILPDSDPNLPDDQLLKMYKVTQGGGGVTQKINILRNASTNCHYFLP